MSNRMSRKDFLHLRFLAAGSKNSADKGNCSQEEKNLDIDLPPEFNSFLFQEAQHLGLNMDNKKEEIEKQILQALWGQV